MAGLYERFLLILFFLFSGIIGKAQYAPVTTAGSVTSCSGIPINISLSVTGFDDITAVSLRLDYNPQLLFYNGFSNPNLILNGMIVNNVTISDTLNKLMIVWSDVAPQTIGPGGVLFELNFTLSAGPASLVFNNDANNGGDCEYSDAAGNPLIDVPTSDYYFNCQITSLSPAIPGNITGTTAICTVATGEPYSLDPVGNATSYQWTVPPGVIITDGQNTNSIVVDFPAGSSSGIMIVNGVNSCGTGLPSPPLYISVNPAPATPYIWLDGDMLFSSSPDGNQWYDQSGLIPGADENTFTPWETGDYYDIVTLIGCSSGSSNIVHAEVLDLNERSPQYVKFYPNPCSGKLIIDPGNMQANSFKISIINAFGKEVYNQKDIKGYSIIDLDFLPDGFYIIKLFFDDEHIINQLLVITKKGNF